MNYEEKYKQALERAMKLAIDGYLDAIAINDIFPELKESEDERIKREIVAYINELANLKNEKIPTEWLKWLEKQGEQPTDKVEPKFKVKDWVILNGIVAQILGKLKYGFVGLDIDGKDFFCNYGHTDSMRLWTINDAKDGDVLVDSYSKDSIIILYKGIDKERSILAHCGWNGYNLFVPSNDGLGYGGLDNTNYLPATKEQRDLLFSKIVESGYEWDVEKKELMKLNSPLMRQLRCLETALLTTMI